MAANTHHCKKHCIIVWVWSRTLCSDSPNTVGVPLFFAVVGFIFCLTSLQKLEREQLLLHINSNVFKYCLVILIVGRSLLYSKYVESSNSESAYYAAIYWWGGSKWIQFSKNIVKSLSISACSHSLVSSIVPLDLLIYFPKMLKVLDMLLSFVRSSHEKCDGYCKPPPLPSIVLIWIN